MPDYIKIYNREAYCSTLGTCLNDQVRDRRKRGITSVSSPWQHSNPATGVSIITNPSLSIDKFHILQPSAQLPSFRMI